MAQGSIITEEMRQTLKIGEETKPFVYEVERGWIRRFANAIGDPNPLWHDEEYAKKEGAFGSMIAQPTFFAAMDPVETKELRREELANEVPYKRSSGGNAFNEVEYFQPIKVGDTIYVTTTYTDIYERDGRTGRLLFRVRENVLKNQRGEIVAKTRCGHVTGYDLSQKKES